MTKEAHELMMQIFAVHLELFMALFHVLSGRGLLGSEEKAKIWNLAHSIEPMKKGLLSEVRVLDTDLGKSLGLQIPA
jgi:hypothetical protein